MTTTLANQLVLPGQAAAPPGPVDVSGMYVIHHAFRRDMGEFAVAVARTPVEDRDTWAALAKRWRQFFDVLHKHHSGEDSGLWPMLMKRVDAGDRATLEAMEAQHAEIDPLLESCAAGFDRLAECADTDTRDALNVRIVALAERLSRHLIHEERDAMALVQRHLTQADWERLEVEHFKPKYSPRDIPFAASWVLHRLPADQFGQVRDAIAGRPLEILWRLFWRRPFERRERQAFKYV